MYTYRLSDNYDGRIMKQVTKIICRDSQSFDALDSMLDSMAWLLKEPLLLTGVPMKKPEENYRGASYEFFHRILYSIEHERFIDSGDDYTGTEKVLELLIEGNTTLKEACKKVGRYIDGEYIKK